MNIIKALLFAFITSLGLSTFVFVGSIVGAQGVNIQNSLCQGANFDPNSSEDCASITGGSGENVQGVIAEIINIFSLVVGVIAVIMIIIGGVKYITSGGDSGNVTGAKNTILYAIVGLVIVALAQTIVFFVLGQATQL